MDRAGLLGFLRSQFWAVEASASAGGDAQAAIIGFAVTDDLQIVFETLDSTRKIRNLRQNPRIALVVGGWGAGDERTVQYEGLADEPQGAELERLKAIYVRRFPEGWSGGNWPGWAFVRVRPTWVRYSDFTQKPPSIVEFSARDLMG
ncbi:MAG TPA: pyridoxamine 5'-phosphate oxidase family protein [Burkholderiales bacterium]|nr:pyridoxamine 5'-phosphate oxidase family protein [Burkholderiales bacterium]